MFLFLRSNKIYFRKHYKKAVGCPDIALPSKKKAVFIDSDFWHGWKFKLTEKRLPNDFWKNKIRGNIARDAKNKRVLKKQGWKVLRIWEHQLIKDKSEKTLNSLLEFLKE